MPTVQSGSLMDSVAARSQCTAGDIEVGRIASTTAAAVPARTYHMWMADPHVISALREKRSLVSGLIEKLERKLEQHRADLTHIDGVLRLFQPDRDPETSSRSARMPGGRGTSRTQRVVAALHGRAQGD